MRFFDEKGDGGSSQSSSGPPGFSHKMFTGGERKDASRVPTADAAARVTGHVPQRGAPQIPKSGSTTVPAAPSSQEVQVDPYPLYGLLLYRGDSLEAREFYESMIVDLGEASGRSILYLDIGHSGQRNPAFEKNAPAELRKQFDQFAKIYPGLVVQVGDEQFHRLRETRELAALLAVPESELPCFAYLTNPPQGTSNFPTLHFKDAWLSSAARRHVLSRTLASWHKGNPIESLITIGRTTTDQLITRLREKLKGLSAEVDQAVILAIDEWEGTSLGLPGLEWSADCHWVKLHDTEYTFSHSQAAVMKALIDLSLRGPRELREATILEEAGKSGSKIRHLFGRHPAWRKLITPGIPKGTIRLRLDRP